MSFDFDSRTQELQNGGLVLRFSSFNFEIFTKY